MTCSSSQHCEHGPRLLETDPSSGFQHFSTLAWFPSCLTANPLLVSGWFLHTPLLSKYCQIPGVSLGSSCLHVPIFSLIHLLWLSLFLSLLQPHWPPCCTWNTLPARAFPRAVPSAWNTPLPEICMAPRSTFFRDISPDILFKTANPSRLSSVPIPLSCFIFLHSNDHPPLNRSSTRAERLSAWLTPGSQPQGRCSMHTSGVDTGQITGLH